MKSKIIRALVPLFVLAALSAVFVGLIWQPHAHARADAARVEEDRDDGSVGPAEHEQESRLLSLDETCVREFGIETAAAGPGKLNMFLTLPGEVTLNADRLAHIVPRVPGVASEVFKNLGDRVTAGEVLAVIESRELADLKAAYLAAVERLSLAEANFTREEGLWRQKISAEQEYLNARRALAEVRIELRASEQKLHALGFTEAYLTELPKLPHESFTRHQIVAPIDGTVIEKHIVLGEVLKDDRECFAIADQSSVWVNLNVYQNDLASIRVGQKVTIAAGPALQAQGTISFVSSLVSPETRTTVARVVLANPAGQWRAGLYVTGQVLVEEGEAGLLVPRESLVRLEGATAVFVKEGEGYRARPVTTGRSDGAGTEVLSGLTAGQVYVTRGAFLLKSELNKPTEAE